MNGHALTVDIIDLNDLETCLEFASKETVIVNTHDKHRRVRDRSNPKANAQMRGDSCLCDSCAGHGLHDVICMVVIVLVVLLLHGLVL